MTGEYSVSFKVHLLELHFALDFNGVLPSTGGGIAQFYLKAQALEPTTCSWRVERMCLPFVCPYLASVS
jgi:hypothetical protein